MSRGLAGSLMLAALVMAAGQSHAVQSPRAMGLGAVPPRALGGTDVEAIRAACRTPDPFLAVAVLGGGAAEADPTEVAAVVAFRHGGGSDSPIVLATRADVGDVYGLAYDPARSCLYAAAYHRALGSYGPAGPGGIYRIDLQTGDISVVTVVDVGTDVHALGDPDHDARMVGRTSLGDLDLAESSSELYVTDLRADRLLRIALPGGELRERVPHEGERASGARTFGLAVRAGWVYQGVVDTIDAGGALQAAVYRSRPGTRDGHEVLRFGLDYARTFRGIPWRAWDEGAGAAAFDSATVADVAFRLGGAPIVGLRDRFADMDPIGVWSRVGDAGPSVGDIVPSRLGTDARSWEAVRTPPWYQDSDDADLDVTFGALASLPGQDVVVSAGRDREAAGDPRLAAYWFSNDSGSVLRWRTLVDRSTVAGGATAIAALAGGDIEVLCPGDAAVDPAFAATGTAEAVAAATARASEAVRIRSTEHAATQTAAQPVQEARHTAAVATAAVVAPVLTAEAPTALAASTLAAGTQTAWAHMPTAYAPTAEALATRRARSTAVPEPTLTAAAAAYDVIKGTCGSHNPYLVTARLVPRLDGNGEPYSPYWLWSQPAVVAFNDTQPQDSGRHVVLASEPQVGAVYGVAQDLVRDQVYVGAYTKRLSAFGPLGPGGIYRIDLRTNAVEPWAVLDAGRDPHALRNAFDLAAASAVGRVGLGDLELSESGDQLFAVNLHDRLIYRLSVPDGRLLGAFPHGATGLPWSADAVPFALAVRGGWLYHGVVDVGRETPDEPAPAARPAAIYVYRSRSDGREMTEVTRLALDHGRTPAWQTWRRAVPEGTTRPEPILADIEFRLDGDLVLGIRDRAGDARILTAGHGDMVLTMRVDVGGSGERFIPLTEPEVYRDNLRHAESSWGGLAALPWLDETVSTVIDPVDIYSGGAAWFDNVGGGAVRLEEVYAGANQTFGKASGLGDVEALCAALTPTPSSTPSATPTQRGTASPSPTASPSLTAGTTPTATPGRYVIYLPDVDRERACIPKAVHSDVILVLDMSTSMYRRTQADRTKHEAALEAARSLARLMAFTPDEFGGYDQLAVVGFNDTAWTQQPLTNDAPAILAALDLLLARIAEGTRLDLALEEAVRNAEGPGRRGDNQPIAILLTDGLPNRVPTPAPAGSQADTVVRVAAQARSRGLRLFTVGLGEPDDVLRPLLEACASEPSMYYYAPDGEDLVAIYRAIAGRIVGCP